MNINRANQLKLNGPNGSRFYGGNQDWYYSNTWSMGGCGSVAGANALRLLARTNEDVRKTILESKQIPSEIKSALCSLSTTKHDFSLVMTGIYERMWAFEVFPLNRLYDKSIRGDKRFKIIKPNNGLTNFAFIIGLIRYARKLNLNISIKSLSAAFCDKAVAYDFIETGLSTGGSIVMLTSYNAHKLSMYPSDSLLEKPLDSTYKSYEATMKCHFATITDIDSENDRLLITTWGQPAVGDFNEISSSWQSIKAFQSTLMYIAPTTRRDSNMSILNSWRPFVNGLLRSVTRGKLSIKC